MKICFFLFNKTKPGQQTPNSDKSIKQLRMKILHYLNDLFLRFSNNRSKLLDNNQNSIKKVPDLSLKVVSFFCLFSQFKKRENLRLTMLNYFKRKREKSVIFDFKDVSYFW